MGRDNETTTKFRVDISELKKEMQEAKRQVQVANSEFKAISSSMEDWTKSTDGISAKLKQLDANLKSQKTVLSSLEKQYELTVAQMGEGSAQADRLKIAINNQKAVVNGTQKEIAKYENVLSEVGKAEGDAGTDADKLGKDLDDLSDKAKGAGEGFTVFKGVLANLATQGINLLIDGVKNAGKALVGMVTDSVNAYAEYEQLVGGVDTLFKESSKTVQEYANNAYKTAGMSANEYMETVTSFSASLLQSLGGDTAKSAEVADMAITDMSDNANKMGTSMEAIQNAYNGFAKGNFTMLDNLKLGYGGTQEEMKRLLKDAEALSGQKYDISNLNDVYQAIHVVQGELGITGTTAKEASSTISGSVASMKSAWTNLITGMSDENANFDQLVTNLVDSVTTMLGNILPVATKAIGGLGQLFTALAPVIATELPKMINDVLPTLLESLSALLQAILQAIITSLPTIIQTVLDVLLEIVDVLLGMIPDLTKAVVNIITMLIKALSKALPEIVTAVIELVPQIIDALMSELPTYIQACIDFWLAMVEAIPTVIQAILTALPQIINSIINGLVSAIPQLIQGAIQLLMAIVDAIPVILQSLIQALPTIINAIINGLITGIPQLIQGAIQLFMALIKAIPVIVTALAEALPQIIDTITTTLLDNLPLLLDTAVQVFMAIVQAIPQIVVALAQALPEIISTIMGTMGGLLSRLVGFVGDLIGKIIEWSGQMRDKASEGASQLVTKVVEWIKQLPEKIWTWLTNVITKVTTWATDLARKGKEAGQELMDSIIEKVKEIPDKIKTIGSDIVKGLWEGINDMAGWIKEKITGFGEGVLNNLKDFFGIHSPSKLMADEVGKWLPEGIAVGIDKNAKSVMSAMKDLTMNTLGATRDGLSELGVNGGVTGGVVNNFTQVINSPKQLSRLDIYRQSKNLLGYAGGGM